ncbi:MAG: hypothetical protein ABSB67_00575 [Bryobacteraceae bacterium]|jgi:hypothetical protein
MQATEVFHDIPQRTGTVMLAWLDSAIRHVTAWAQSAAIPVSFLLRNFALASGVLGVWRLGMDLGWTQDFFISSGIGSHWQVWLALAAGLNAAANFILRAARHTDAQPQ